MKQLVISFLIILSLGGCSAGKDIKTAEVKQIKKGVTTEQQILDWFGEPTSSSSDFSRKTKTLVYQYDNSDKLGHSIAGGFGASFGSVLGPLGAMGGGVLGSNAVKGREETKQLMVVINTNNSKVVDFNYSKTQGRTRGLGTGSGIDKVGS